MRIEEGIYLIAVGESVKIGRSKRFDKRLKALMTSMPKHPTAIHYWKVFDSQKEEKGLHRKYRDKRLHGEWFKLDQDDISEIVAKYNSRPIPTREPVKVVSENNKIRTTIALPFSCICNLDTESTRREALNLPSTYTSMIRSVINAKNLTEIHPIRSTSKTTQKVCILLSTAHRRLLDLKVESMGEKVGYLSRGDVVAELVKRFLITEVFE